MKKTDRSQEKKKRAKHIKMLKQIMVDLISQQIVDHSPLAEAIVRSHAIQDDAPSCHRDVKIIKRRMDLRQREIWAIVREFASLHNVPRNMRIRI